MTGRLSDLSKQALKDIRNSSTLEELDSVRVQYLGKKGSVSTQLKNLSELDPSDRPRIGKEVNKLKKLVEKEISNKKSLLNDKKIKSPLIKMKDINLGGFRDRKETRPVIKLDLKFQNTIYKDLLFTLDDMPPASTILLF